MDYKTGGLVEASDREIEKSNRLFTLKQVHEKWVAGNTEQEEVRVDTGKKIDNCELCDKEGVATKMYYGKSCCATCGAIRGLVKNNPAIVADVYREFHGTWLSAGEPVQDAPADEDAKPVDSRLAAATEKIDRLQKELEDKVDTVSRVNYGLLKKIQTKDDIIASIRNVTGLDETTSDDELADVIEEILSSAHGNDLEVVDNSPDIGRVYHKLGLALAIIRGDGKVIADTLELMHGN